MLPCDALAVNGEDRFQATVRSQEGGRSVTLNALRGSSKRISLGTKLPPSQDKCQRFFTTHCLRPRNPIPPTDASIYHHVMHPLPHRPTTHSLNTRRLPSSRSSDMLLCRILPPPKKRKLLDALPSNSLPDTACGKKQLTMNFQSSQFKQFPC